jgi:predicted CXXCH cytochrome family protein
VGLNKKNVHTALKKAKCIACHDPHASQASRLLKAEGNQACYQCHKKENYEKKVIHKIEQTKGCTACHRSHSSDEKNLLVKADPSLCLTCHDSTKGSFKKAHAEYPVSKGSCLSCHNPHTSLQAKLLKTSIHNPIKEGCDACHKPASAEKPFETTETGSKLCSNCHDASS